MFTQLIVHYRKIAASAVTVVKNEDTILPFKVQQGDHILLLGVYDNELPGLELGIKRLKADGVIPEGVSFETVRYSSSTSIEDIKEKIDQASHVIVISEIGRESQLASDVWLTKLPTQVIDYANANAKKAVVMSISKPYDVANYPTAKAIVAVYGNKGMDPTEGLKPDNAFGPNIPAGVEVIFNGQKHIGRLPVDVPVIKEGRMSETEIAYPIGHGLLYSDPVKNMELTLPAFVRVAADFTASITLGDLQGLDKNDYQLVVTVDGEHFSLLPSDGYIVEGTTALIRRKAGDSQPVRLELKALAVGQFSPVRTIFLRDNQGRDFSMGSDYYKDVTLQITASSTSTENLVKKEEKLSNKTQGKEASELLSVNHKTPSLQDKVPGKAPGQRQTMSFSHENRLPNTGEELNKSGMLIGISAFISSLFLILNSPICKIKLDRKSHLC